MRRPKAAVVSGGTCGIGRALVEALVDDGYRVGFSGRVRERVEAVVTSVASRHPHRIVGITGDASLPGHATALITAVRETFPAWASVYVLCAGQGLPGRYSSESVREAARLAIGESLVSARRLTEVDTAALREAPAYECANDLSRSEFCSCWFLKSGSFAR